MSDEEKDCFSFYEKAIEGRNFHYQNYNSWVNLYSIFTGALFVAYYSIGINGGDFFQMLLGFLGLITSICWISSVRGFYHWMISWIKIVQDYEKQINELEIGDKTKYYVYSVLKPLEKDKYHKNLSTQKITVIFILCVIVGWILLILNTVFDDVDFIKSFADNELCLSISLSKIIMFVIGIIAVIVVSILVNKQASNSSNMTKDIHGEEWW